MQSPAATRQQRSHTAHGLSLLEDISFTTGRVIGKHLVSFPNSCEGFQIVAVFLVLKGNNSPVLLSHHHTKHRRSVVCWPFWVRTQAALAASQADHQETQRRISSLQEKTKGLSILDFPEHQGHQAGQTSASGSDVGKCEGVAGTQGPSEEEKPRSDLHQLHCMTLVRRKALT